MKKSLTTLLLLFAISIMQGQIKEIKFFGDTINVIGVNGEKTGSYMLQKSSEKYLGYNSNYFLIQRNNQLLIMNNKGFQYSNNGISMANGRTFIKITEKSIWIMDNTNIIYFDFSGNRLSNYRE